MTEKNIYTVLKDGDEEQETTPLFKKATTVNNTRGPMFWTQTIGAFSHKQPTITVLKQLIPCVYGSE